MHYFSVGREKMVGAKKGLQSVKAVIFFLGLPNVDFGTSTDQ